MNSKDYDEFYKSCFPKSFGEAHDGLNVQAVLALKGPERNRAKNILLKVIKNKKESLDYRPIEAIGYLKIQEAAPILENLLEKYRQTKQYILQTFTVWALYQINGYPDAQKYIIEMYYRIPTIDPYNSSKWHAIKALVDIGKSKLVVDFLEDLITNFDSFEGFYAFEGLQKLFSTNEAIMFQLNEFNKIRRGRYKNDEEKRGETEKVLKRLSILLREAN